MKLTELVMEKNENKWETVGGKLIRTFYFDNYTNVMKFVNKVMEIAEKQNHHPEMIVHYDYVKLTIFDHEKKKISDKCHKFEDAVNKIYK